MQRNEEPHLNIIIAQQLSNILFDTNFGINFVLYCATGQNFRAIVVRILCNRCQRKNNKTLSSTQRSSQRNLYGKFCKVENSPNFKKVDIKKNI